MAAYVSTRDWKPSGGGDCKARSQSYSAVADKVEEWDAGYIIKLVQLVTDPLGSSASNTTRCDERSGQCVELNNCSNLLSLAL